MRCNRAHAFFLVEENMPPLAFFVSLLALAQKGLTKTDPLRRFFLKLYALIRLTRVISPYRRYAKPSDGSTKDPKPLL